MNPFRKKGIFRSTWVIIYPMVLFAMILLFAHLDHSVFKGAWIGSFPASIGAVVALGWLRFRFTPGYHGLSFANKIEKGSRSVLQYIGIQVLFVPIVACLAFAGFYLVCLIIRLIFHMPLTGPAFG